MENNEKKTSGFLRKTGAFFAGLGKTVWRWIRRMVLGASKDLAADENDIFAVEKLESPSRMAVKTFFRRKLAVAALCVLILLFLFVFIGPLFVPMDVNFTDTNQGNIAPNLSLRSVPGKLKKQIAYIDGYANFTLGVSKDHTLYAWGYTKNALTKADYADFPKEIRKGNVFAVSTGTDHAIAITTDGKLVGWGNNTRAQYGHNDSLNEDDPVIFWPEELVANGLDTSKVQQLVCGYQVSALVYDGHLYMWGNANACSNMRAAMRGPDGNGYDGVKKVSLTNYYVTLLMEDGSIVSPDNILKPESARSSRGQSVRLLSYLETKKVKDIDASNNCFAFVTEDGEVLVQGASKYGEAKCNLPAGEKAVKITAGAFHFAVLTESGKAYAWGANDKGQCKVNGKECADVFTGAYQTYLVDNEGKLIKSVGLRGYPFGTDNRGRDTFTRIVHGGKMTMTIGAVAVIVSTVIAIIIGCLSGYFGGWVDMLLMRVTEIFSAIPFLPFAMLLSYILSTRPIGETMRIFIIMLILGLLSWTGLARMIRGQVLAEREKEFVLAAKAMGIKEKRIAFKHILPNVISVILVSMTLDFAGCLLTESSLSYLGFGVQQPRPTWGNMLNGANNSTVIQTYWWQWFFPALFLSIATISINIIGDTLRDVLDPRSSQEK